MPIALAKAKKPETEVEVRFRDVLRQFPGPAPFALGFPAYLEQLTEQAKTTEDANTARAIGEMGLAYLKQKLPGAVYARDECYRLMWPNEKAYVETSAVAGIMWASQEKNKGGPEPIAERSQRLATPLEAGFRSERDAVTCVRIGSLDPEDRRTYFEEQQTKGAHITLNGAENIWRDLFGEGHEPGLESLIRAALRNASNAVPKADGDVKAMLVTVVQNLRDCQEMLEQCHTRALLTASIIG